MCKIANCDPRYPLLHGYIRYENLCCEDELIKSRNRACARLIACTLFQLYYPLCGKRKLCNIILEKLIFYIIVENLEIPIFQLLYIYKYYFATLCSTTANILTARDVNVQIALVPSKIDGEVNRIPCVQGISNTPH